VKHEIALSAYNTDMFILLFFKQIARILFFLYSSLSVLARNSFISKIEAIEYNVCHVCHAFTTMSATSMRSFSTMSVTVSDGPFMMSVTVGDGRFMMCVTVNDCLFIVSFTPVTARY
jgi:hypothetical protein